MAQTSFEIVVWFSDTSPPFQQWLVCCYPMVLGVALDSYQNFTLATCLPALPMCFSRMFDSKSSSGWSATAPSRHYSSSWESLTQGNFDKLVRTLTPLCGIKKDYVL